MSSGADRKRATLDRLDRGIVARLPVDVTDDILDALRARGLLAPESDDSLKLDRPAASEAVHEWLNISLGLTGDGEGVGLASSPPLAEPPAQARAPEPPKRKTEKLLFTF